MKVEKIAFANGVSAWDRFLFEWSGILGTSPFTFHDGTISLTWLSFRTLKCLLVTLIAHLYLVYYGVGFGFSLYRDGFAASAQFFPWIAALFMACGVLLSLFLRHKQLIHHFNHSTLHREKGPFRRKWTQDKKWLFLVWLIVFVALPTISLLFHIGVESRHKAYITNNAWVRGLPAQYQPWITVLAIVLHGYSFLLCWASVFIGDLLSLYLASGYQRKFEDINLRLLNLVPMLITGQVMDNQAPEVHYDELNAGEPHQEPTPSVSQVISDELKSHLEIQKELIVFNQSFAPFLVIFVLQVFIMCIGLFFSILKNAVHDEYDLFIHISLGLQYLIRAFIGLSTFGRVERTGKATKNILVKDLQIQYFPEAILNRELEREIQHFMTTCDDICLSAGSYIDFSRSYLISFYGVLATYIAIFIQSI